MNIYIFVNPLNLEADYEVLLFFFVFVFQEVQASTLVSVNLPVTNVSVSCPKVTASHEEMECLLTVVDGSSLTVTSDMGDDQGPQTYTIAGIYKRQTISV